MEHGTVKFFNNAKGFGFITPDDNSKDVFVHKNDLIDGFTKKYNVFKLVYFETTKNVNSAIAREKEVKGWRRDKKERLVSENNPEWADLSLRL